MTDIERRCGADREEEKVVSYLDRRYRVVRFADKVKNGRGFHGLDNAIKVAQGLAREHGRQYVVWDMEPEGDPSPIQIYLAVPGTGEKEATP